ncbi:MAG: tRNA-dihydrouridine synthase, partial [Planctomycetota bacterium]
ALALPTRTCSSAAPPAAWATCSGLGRSKESQWDWKHWKAWGLIRLLGGLDDHPIAGQIMGTHPDEMAQSAQVLAAMGFDVIDVNFACPVKKVSKANRGGHFLTAPEEAIDVLRAVRAAVPAEIPTSVKLRRAWDDTPEMEQNFDRIFEALYDEGYVWATVHGRTVEQKYVGPSRWQFLRDLTTRYPDRLIFGSGDIWEAADVFRMLDATGVHAVSVARGCIGNPWIFQQTRQLMAGETPMTPTLEEQRSVLLEHYRFSVALHGEHRASKMMRKFGIQFSKHHPRPDEAKAAFIRCRSLAEWHDAIREMYGPSASAP